MYDAQYIIISIVSYTIGIPILMGLSYCMVFGIVLFVGIRLYGNRVHHVDVTLNIDIQFSTTYASQRWNVDCCSEPIFFHAIDDSFGISAYQPNMT